MTRMRILSAAFVLALTGAACATPAYAGEWRLDPARCPDLVEDRLDRAESRRDRRVNRGPADRIEDRIDRRESRRDERVTVCPRSAWVWYGGGRRVARPAAATVFYDPVDAVYFRNGPRGARVRIVVR
ncbi:MAG: hypothetical protein AAGJ87_08755 [Pseudomonadota bacterium]